MFHSLRFRLTLIFVVLIVGPLFAVSITVGVRSFATLEGQSLEFQRMVAANVGSEIRAFIEGRKHELVLLDEVHRLGTLEFKEQRAILSTMLLRNRVYQEIVLLNADGQEQIRLSRSRVFLDDDFESRAKNDEFLLPATKGVTYFSPVHFDETIREPLITISVPLFDKRSGAIISVLGADLRFKIIWDLLADIELSSESDVYVIDQAGQVVAHRNPTIVLGDTTIDLPDADGRAEGLSGTDVIIARYRLQFGEQELVVVAEQPVSDALELAINSIRVEVAITFIALIFAIILVLLITRQIVRPIEAMATSAQAISHGDFSQRVKVYRWDKRVIMNRVVSMPIRLLSAATRQLTGGKWKVASIQHANNEIGELARSFNLMAHALEERENILKVPKEELQEAHDNLEQRVEKRTLELARTNEKLDLELAEHKKTGEALNQQQEEQQIILDSVPAMIFYKDKGDRFIRVNEALAKAFNLSKEEIIGRTAAELSPNQEKDYWEDDKQVMVSGQPKRNIIEPVATSEGTRWVQTDKIPYKDKKRNIIGIIGFSIDITERKQLEEQFRQSQKMEAVGRLAGGVAHDFNNLLTAMLGYSEMLIADPKLNDSQRKYIEEIKKASERAASLTQQLLAFSRKQILKPKILNINTLVTDIKKMLHRLIGEDIHLISILDSKLGVIKADPGQIEQIIMNFSSERTGCYAEGWKINY